MPSRARGARGQVGCRQASVRPPYRRPAPPLVGGSVRLTRQTSNRGGELQPAARGRRSHARCRAASGAARSSARPSAVCAAARDDTQASSRAGRRSARTGLLKAPAAPPAARAERRSADADRAGERRTVGGDHHSDGGACRPGTLAECKAELVEDALRRTPQGRQTIRPVARRRPWVSPAAKEELTGLRRLRQEAVAASAQACDWTPDSRDFCLSTIWALSPQRAGPPARFPSRASSSAAVSEHGLLLLVRCGTAPRRVIRLSRSRQSSLRERTATSSRA